METESFECLLESDAYEMYQDMMKKAQFMIFRGISTEV